MRTLSTQVRLRRLLRAFTEDWTRLSGAPPDRATERALVGRLEELAGATREAWERESLEAGRSLPEPLHDHVEAALRQMELAVLGLSQRGADLELLRRDFEAAAVPLEFVLRGLDAEPALERSA